MESSVGGDAKTSQLSPRIQAFSPSWVSGAPPGGRTRRKCDKSKISNIKYCKGKEKKDRTLFFLGFIITEAQQVPLWRTNLMLFYKKRKRNANHPKSSIQNWMTIFTHVTQKSKACWGFNCQFVPVCSSRDPNPNTRLPPPAALMELDLLTNPSRCPQQEICATPWTWSRCNALVTTKDVWDKTRNFKAII